MEEEEIEIEPTLNYIVSVIDTMLEQLIWLKRVIEEELEKDESL